MGTVTIDPNTYDIFGDSSGADAYLLARIGSTWATATATVKAQSLVSATRAISTYLANIGVALPTGQTIATITDVALLNANYELANALFVDTTILDGIDQSGNTRSVTAKGTGITYFRPTDSTVFPKVAQRLLNQWLATVAGASGVSGPEFFGFENHSILRDEGSAPCRPIDVGINLPLS